jgi:hypothetical protein
MPCEIALHQAAPRALGAAQARGKPHEAVRAWCAAQGHALAGPNWEVYGHWNHDPQQLITEVFYLLSNS